MVGVRSSLLGKHMRARSIKMKIAIEMALMDFPVSCHAAGDSLLWIHRGRVKEKIRFKF